MTRPLAIQLRKEARALLPWWLGAATATTAVAILSARNAGFPWVRADLVLWILIVHAVGVLALAAWSMGQELAHGTLPSLLAQPTHRLKVLATKFAVLIPAVVTLGLLADNVVVDAYLAGNSAPRTLLIWGPVLAGIGLVPLLTVLTRRPLGGVVFAIQIPGLLFIVSERFYSLLDGRQAWTITWYGTVVASVAAAAALWHLFPRLQTAGGGRRRPASPMTAQLTSSSVDRAVVSAENRKRHWVWMQVRKELRLQQMTLAVSGLYVVACAVVAAIRYSDPLYSGPTFGALSALHGVIIAILAGSLASAEERQLGTLTSELLLPQAVWRHWSIKALATGGLTMALAVGLPAVLMLVHKPTDPFVATKEFVLGMLLIACVSMYVSSLCTTSLWALLASFPAIAMASFAGDGIILPFYLTLREWLLRPSRSRIYEIVKYRWTSDLEAHLRRIHSLEYYLPLLLAAGLGLLVLYFASRNHRSLERSVQTVLWQVTCLAGYATVAVGTYVVVLWTAWETVR